MGAVVIEVVLPTYNGADYLEQQLASIYDQSVRPQQVLIRDDGSTDGTLDLLIQIKYRYGNWVRILPSSEGNIGCIANTNRLLQATTASYIALADQDDIWFACKLERSLAMIKQLEARHGCEIPLLVHSDLKLVDANCNNLGCTYLQRQRLNPLRCGPADLALTNVVTGCSVILNRALLQRALPIPNEVAMHDWWLALVASVFGEIAFLDNPTLAYRQHGSNVLGAQGFGFRYWITRIRELLAGPPDKLSVSKALRQAQTFEQCYGVCLSKLPALMTLPRRERLQVLWALFMDQPPTKHGPLRTISLYMLLIFLPR